VRVHYDEGRRIVASDGKPRTVIAIRLSDRRVCAELNAKSVSEAVAEISEQGLEALIIQGKPAGDAQRGRDRRAAQGEATGRGSGSVSKIPSLNQAEAEFVRRMDEVATGVMASLYECAHDAADSGSLEVEQWQRRGTAIVQELTMHVLALASVSTERKRADLMRALDALRAPGRVRCGRTEVEVP